MSDEKPAYDGGFTAADMMDARQEGRKEAQQPAADSPSFTAGDMTDAAAQGFRDGVASVGAERLTEALRYAVDNPEFDSQVFDTMARAALRDHDQEATND